MTVRSGVRLHRGYVTKLKKIAACFDTTAEAARAIGVSRNALVNWLRDGTKASVWRPSLKKIDDAYQDCLPMIEAEQPVDKPVDKPVGAMRRIENALAQVENEVTSLRGEQNERLNQIEQSLNRLLEMWS